MDYKLRTPNSEPRTAFLRKDSFDEILLQLTQVGLPDPPVFLRKVLFWGEGAGEISSYVAGWMAEKGIEVIVLDGANRFNAYTVSSLARRALIPPEKLLKSIRIARAFTCYQMATLMGEQLISLLKQKEATELLQKRWVILLGPLTTFLDEDVPEREARPLFERSLRKIEGMASKGVPFLLFQSSVPSPSFPKERMGGVKDSKRAYLMRRLFQFSNEAWRVDLDEEGPKMILAKGVTKLQIADRKSQIEDPPFTGAGILSPLQPPSPHRGRVVIAKEGGRGSQVPKI